jgi:hypothetical protein
MISRNACLSFGIGFLAAIGVSCSTTSRIKHYSGDGEIKAKPDYGFWGGGGGYTLQFKPIKLDQPAHFTYRFAGLPQWKTEAFFAIEDPRWWEDKAQYERDQRKGSAAERNGIKVACYDDLSGTLAMSLKDTKGNMVFQFEKKLRELRWSGSGSGLHELYDEQTVFFTPDSREYILEITIDPDPMLKDDRGYVLFRGGGHEPVPVGFR